MNEYHLSDEDLQMILTLSSYRQMTTSKPELDSKTKTTLSKLFQKDSHQRKPFQAIDRNPMKSRKRLAQEDDDDDDSIVLVAEDDSDKENRLPIELIAHPAKPNRKRRRK